jgi:Holliday junction resolvase RusA-like endonuclease
MLGKPHQQKSDLDNLEKSVLDSLLPEDCTVWHIEAKKFWSEEPMLVLENIYEW